MELAGPVYRVISRHPGAVIAVILASFLLSLGAFSHIEVDEDFEAGISDPEARATRALYRQHFGHEQAVLVAYGAGEIRRESLVRLWELTDRIRRWPEVRRVMSVLDTLRPCRTRAEFEAYLKDFRIRNLKDLLARDELFRGFLVSRDLKAFQLLVIPDLRIPTWRNDLYHHLNKDLPGESGGHGIHLYGFPYVQERFFEFIGENNERFLTLGFLCCSVLAWFFFPDPVILGLILLSIVIPSTLTFAVYFMNGNKVNLFTSPIIPFALIISLNEIIYIISFFVRERTRDDQTYAGFHEDNFRRLIRPCLINTVTTLIGFLSLCQNPSPSIRLFSIYTSLACFFSYVVTFGLIFSFLRLYQPKFSLGAHRPADGAWFRKALRNLVFRHPGKILAVTIVVIAVSFPGALSFERRNALTDNFPAGDPLVAAHRFMQERFCGPAHFQVLLSHSDLLAPRHLKAIAEFQKRVEAIPGIDRVFSIIDLMRAFNRQFTGDDAYPVTTDYARGVVEAFGSRGISELLVAPDFTVGLLRVSTGLTDDFAIEPLRGRILAEARAVLPPDLRVDVTGDVYLNALMQKNILENITWSFAAAVLMIIGVFFLVFRRLGIAFTALVVNFYPIFCAYMLARLAGLPLNPSTGVVGCVMSGLIVDDTLHLLTFYQEVRQPTTVRKVLATLRELTVPVIYSALLLGLGNAIFIFSPFKPFASFGFIGTLIVITGVIGDLVVMPAMVLALGREKGS